MSNWVFRVGVVLVVVGAALLSPLVDLLPVGFLSGVREGTAYLRVVPATESGAEVAAWALFGLGVLAVLGSFIARRRRGAK